MTAEPCLTVLDGILDLMKTTLWRECGNVIVRYHFETLQITESREALALGRVRFTMVEETVASKKSRFPRAVRMYTRRTK